MATGEYRLLIDPDAVASAFEIWRNALTEQGIWRGDAWWLPQERIVFANRNERSVPELGEYVVLGTDPTGNNVTVQLNEPQQHGNENPLSGIAQDGAGRLHLVRQGVLHKNAQSDRVDGKLFKERTRLEPVTLHIGTAPARRSWFSVTPLDIPSAEICRNIAKFVDLCSLARGSEQAKEADEDEDRLAELFGSPEVGGETSGEPTLNPNKRRRLQGEVWLALQSLLRSDGRELLKPRHARGYEVDGEIAIPSGKLLLEIKTSLSAADVYTGVGQLLIYPKLLPRLSGHRKVLLLPGRPSDALATALREAGVELHLYDLQIAGERVVVTFSRRFLKLCQLL